MSKVFKIISDILLVLVILILSLYLILKYTNKIGIYKVVTGSMETNIHPGDYIIVKTCEDYKKGDIVTYKNKGTYITHRIIKVDNDKIITKGDANNTADEEIDKQAVVGKYIFKHNILNFIMDYKFIIIGLIILMFIISEMINRV